MPYPAKQDFIYEAITDAIQKLSEESENEELIRRLNEAKSLLKIPKWTDKMIKQSVEDFIVRNGRMPVAEDFKTDPTLPRHKTIENRYKLNIKSWLMKLYPDKYISKEETKELYLCQFIEDYKILKPYNQNDYELKRNKDNSVSAITLMKYCNVTSWSQLLTKFNLPRYTKHGVEIGVKHKVEVISDI